MTEIVGAEHRFHDPDYVRGWADRFVPTGPRLQLFGLVLSQISRPSVPNRHVVELGIGPGYMARHILERDDRVTYEGVDFSEAMFAVAREIVGANLDRVTLTAADLLDSGWPDRLSRQPGAIVSTWALHDLQSPAAIADVYARGFAALPPGGVLVNGDFIKPDGATQDYEPGRLEIAKHLELLRDAGFADPRCLAQLEPNLVDPTAAQNYACLVAIR